MTALGKEGPVVTVLVIPILWMLAGRSTTGSQNTYQLQATRTHRVPEAGQKYENWTNKSAGPNKQCPLTAQSKQAGRCKIFCQMIAQLRIETTRMISPGCPGSKESHGARMSCESRATRIFTNFGKGVSAPEASLKNCVGMQLAVKESMNNLEEVVRERNEAYHLLEIGESGEQPWVPKENIYGFVRDFALKEHLMPRTCNPKGYFRLWRDKDLNDFLRLYREKMQKRKEFFHRTSRNRIMQIIKRFPHVDRSLLRDMYPDVDIDKLEKIMQEKIYIAYEQQTT
ncbi:hypothetical protein HPB51_001113 [Rhipicephalus microplus]|uniref:Uncharacterized protein n=1 Tax=Rhipicephalus microplus TaxID=6941 RepID=A0A9J6EVI4_RHIMP|nr:hypothetical protein HPB51_001113 [Rhipicephalus microplus]